MVVTYIAVNAVAVAIANAKRDRTCVNHPIKADRLSNLEITKMRSPVLCHKDDLKVRNNLNQLSKLSLFQQVHFWIRSSVAATSHEHVPAIRSIGSTFWAESKLRALFHLRSVMPPAE